jgi:hypothetical protein
MFGLQVIVFRLLNYISMKKKTKKSWEPLQIAVTALWT